MKKIISIILASVLLLSLFGCGGKDNREKKSYSIAFVTDTRGEKDPINAQIIEGVKESFDDYKYDFDVKTPKSISEYENIVSGVLSSKTYDLVLANSNAAATAMIAQRNEYPADRFGFIGYTDKTNSSMSVTFRVQDGAFLAGVLSGLYTKTDRIGYVGAFKNRNTDYYYGFLAGVKAVNKKAQVLPVFTNSYIDTKTAGKNTEKLVAKKADVMFCVCGAGANGVNSVCSKRKIKLIDSDLFTSSDSDARLATVYKDYKNVTTAICESLIFESFRERPYSMGLSETAVDLELNSSNIPKDSKLAKLIEKHKKKIITKNIKIPKNKKTYKAFKYK